MNGSNKQYEHQIGDLVMKKVFFYDNGKRKYKYIIGVIKGIRVNENNVPTAYPWKVEWYTEEGIISTIHKNFNKGEITKFKNLLKRITENE